MIGPGYSRCLARVEGELAPIRTQEAIVAVMHLPETQETRRNTPKVHPARPPSSALVPDRRSSHSSPKEARPFPLLRVKSTNDSRSICKHPKPDHGAKRRRANEKPTSRVVVSREPWAWGRTKGNGRRKQVLLQGEEEIPTRHLRKTDLRR
jgi:hypothetical protein